jgi:hypothetical protein
MSVDAAALIAVLRARGIDVSSEASKVEGDDLKRVFVHRLAIADECRNLPTEWYAVRFAIIEPEPLPITSGAGAEQPTLEGDVEIEVQEAEAQLQQPSAEAPSNTDHDVADETEDESVEDWLKRLEAGESFATESGDNESVVSDTIVTETISGETIGLEAIGSEPGASDLSAADSVQPSDVGENSVALQAADELLPAHGSNGSPLPAVRSVEPDETEWNEAIAGARRPILLWGPPASGKTNFLASLLAKQVDDPVDPYEWRIMTIGWRTGDYLAEILASSKEGRKPRPTMQTAAPYRFEISKVRKERKLLGLMAQDESVKLVADLFVLDPMGELFTRGDLVTSRAGARFLALLQKAGGILLLIDPTHSGNGNGASLQDRIDRDKVYWTMLVSNLSAMIETLKRQPLEVRSACLDDENRLTIPVAVCLTKMDRHPDQLNRAKEFLREQMGAVHGIIERSFRDYRVYACSAYGSGAQHNPDGEHFDGRFRPWQVLEPVKWIIEKNAASARGGLRGKLGW